MSKVAVRFPPSPTGHLHIGTARTMLFNYVFAKRAGGKIIFRSEDTDRTRSKEEFEQEITEGLHWLGLSWNTFLRQSANAPRHQELLEKLVEDGKAYTSKEAAKDEPGREVEVVRLKNPGKSITFTDAVRGEVTFNTTELGDFVIARSITDPLYHFAVVVDDWDEGITHVIRGEDHISNTPRQILIQEALGAPRPEYAHIPLILDENRAKLSKRSPSGVPLIFDYRDEGILPEAIVNYLALLGWNPGGDREDFSLAELVEIFSLDGVQKGGAVFDRTKILSVNQRWMRKLSPGDFIERGGLVAPDAAILEKAVPLLKERARTFGEARDLLAGELSCLFARPSLDRAQLIAKETLSNSTRKYLEGALALVEKIPAGESADAIKAALMPLADANSKESGGRGAVLWPLRYALSGQEKSPDPFTLISTLGREESMARIAAAIALLN
ncbi:MAG: glutamate--tRNA ligase [Minisyncoccia bacterium]